MGIEKLYRDDTPQSSESVMIEAYNESKEIKEIGCYEKSQGISEIEIKETKSEEDGKLEYELLKKPHIKYFFMNKNKRWRTYSDCYNEFLKEVKSEVSEAEGEVYEINFHDSCHVWKTTYKTYVDVESSLRSTKEWVLDTEGGYKVYSVEIFPKTEKEQIVKIENHIGFGGWVYDNSLTDIDCLLWKEL